MTFRDYRKWLASFLMSLSLLAGFSCLVSCNTVEGVGEDTAELGEEIDEAAEDAKD